MHKTSFSNEFYLDAEDRWYWSKKCKSLTKINFANGTFSVIPKMNHIDRRLSLLVASGLKDNYGFAWRIADTDFIIELPECFQNLLQGINNLVFNIKIMQRLFRAELDIYKRIHLKNAGLYDKNAIELEEFYDMSTILGNPSNSTKTSYFWEVE